MELDFGKLNPNSNEPVYMQIVRRFKLLILKNILLDGDEAPSRRMLAASLGVNPNTVQKAFVQLENEGLIETPLNAKSLICVNTKKKEHLRKELLEERLNELIKLAKETGIRYKEFSDLISACWDNE